MMLTGDAHLASDFVFFYEEAATLEQEWQARGIDGVVGTAPTLLRLTSIQHRPDAANPRALADVRVRRALAYGIEGQAAVAVTTGGRGLATHTVTSSRSPLFKAVEGAVPSRRYDPRMVQQFMEEAGFSKGPQGFFVGPGGEPFHMWQQFDTALDPADRARYTADLERLLYENAAVIPGMFTVVVNARVNALRGPVMRTTPDAGAGLHKAHLWEWVR